jgi:PHD/YefM family antitoxin component YafN of YafNO toxin-antitoxin module
MSSLAAFYPMSKRLTIAQAQQQLPNLPDELTDEPIIITQDGVPVIAALSYTHLTELLETLDILTDTEFVAKLRQSITQSEKGDTIPWEHVKAQLEL